MATDELELSSPLAGDDTILSGSDLERTRRLARGSEAAMRPDRIGRFAVGQRLGSGGMGVVYQAHDEQLDRVVALKLLLVEGDDTERARLRREAVALARLSHPNVVEVYEAGTHQGRSFIVMELVRGRPLDRWLADGPRTPQAILDVFLQAGAGLAAAHEAGLIHRDFKPGNVMVGDDGRVRVFDFGLARGVDDDDEDVPQPDEDTSEGPTTELPIASPWDRSLTRAGALLGTPAFMSPEQFDRHAATAASDQFAFCVALFVALHDEHPFIAGPEQWRELPLRVARGQRRDLPTPPGVAPWIRRALVRGLSVEPEQRWPSMRTLLDELTGAGARRRRRRLVGIGGVVLLGLGATSLLSPRPEPCAGAMHELDEVWNDERREQVRAAMRATELPYAEGTAQVVLTRLDDHASRWGRAHHQVCERLTEDPDDSRLDLRMQCVQRQRARLRMQIEALEHADDATVRHAVQALDGLDPVERCLDEQLPQAQLDPPADPELALRVAALQERLDYVETCLRLYRTEEGLRSAAALVAEARDLDHAPTLAWASLYEGLLALRSVEHAHTIEALERAYFLAIDLGVDEIARKAATGLVYVHGVGRLDPESARTWAHHAESVLERSDDPIDRAWFLNNLGGTAELQNRDEEARRHHERALAIRERELGPSHDDVASSRHNLAIVLSKQGHYAEAMEHARASYRIWSEALGESHPRALWGLSVMADVRIAEGAYAEAEAVLTRTLEMLDPSDPGAPAKGEVLWAMGKAQLGQGRLREAARSLDASVLEFSERLGPDDLHLRPPLTLRGEIELRRHRPRRALPPLRRALAIAEAHGASAPDTRFLLARALWDSSQDREGAVAQAREVLASLDEEAPLRAEARAWLDERVPDD